MFDLGALQFCPSVKEAFLVTQDRFGESALACFTPVAADCHQTSDSAHRLSLDNTIPENSDKSEMPREPQKVVERGVEQDVMGSAEFNLQWVFTCAEASKALGRISL